MRLRRVQLAVLPGAFALAAALALWPGLREPALPPPVAGAGGVAVAVYAAALLVPLPGALAWALGLLGIEYLAALALRGDGLDVGVPVYAAGYLACAELGWLGLEARRGGRPWPERLLAIAAVVLAGAAVGGVLLLAAAVPIPGGAPLTALGVAAALAVAACVAWLGRR